MILETERLRLEPFAQQHVAGLHAMDSDPEVMRFIGPVRTLDETIEGIARVSERWQRLGYGWWAVVDKASREILGAACVQYIANVEGAPLEVGWRLATSAQGQGYATEAGSAALQFAFGHLHADLVLAVADQKNTASHNVMRRLGMSYRGIETHYDLPLTTYVKHRNASVSVPS